MRFINTKTLKFETVAEFRFGKDGVKYAILSHQWGPAEEEVLFADVDSSRDLTHKQAYGKVKGFRDKAASLGYKYGWVDTCCIDKSNPEELTEAINSMYRWYQKSDICIIYLADVPTTGMLDSSWWSRGWTLQELIGPENASFYDSSWAFRGTKTELLSEISTKTGIPQDVLNHHTRPTACSVAQRMSWAAKRETIRVEDRAYSLLGLFGVYMDKIYGEGENAFLRLQEAIMAKGKDGSLFPWSMGLDGYQKAYFGLFAPSPDCYVNCGNVISTRGSTIFGVNNGELTINLKTLPHSMDTYYAALNCTQRNNPDARICILISRLSTEDEYVRVNRTYKGGKGLIAPSSLEDFKLRKVCVAVDPDEHPVHKAYGFWLRTIQPRGHSDRQIRILSRGVSSEADKVFLNDKELGTAGVISLEPKVKPDYSYRTDQKGWSRIRWIKLGFDNDFNPMLLSANDRGSNYHHGHRLWQLTNEYFEEATNSEARSPARSRIFNNDWITSEASVPTRSHGWSTGISVLKVDRWKGVSTSLKALNVGIKVQLAPERSPFIRSEGIGQDNDGQIWVVDITDTEGPDPEPELAKATKARAQDECLECLCSGWDDADTNATLSPREIEYRRLRVLTASELERLN